LDLYKAQIKGSQNGYTQMVSKLVTLLKVKKENEIYYYLVHNYKNKFGKQWRRFLHSFKKIKPEEHELARLIKLYNDKRKNQDAIDNLFLGNFNLLGLKGKTAFIEQMKLMFEYTEQGALNEWERALSLFKKLRGNLEPLSKIKPMPKRIRHKYDFHYRRGKPIRFSTRVPIGIIKSLQRIAALKAIKNTRTAALSLSLEWLAERFFTPSKYDIELKITGEPNFYYRLRDKKSNEILAECQYYEAYKPIYHPTCFYFQEPDFLRLDLIANHLKIFSRAKAINLVVLFYATAHKMNQGLFCTYEGIMSKKRGTRRTVLSCKHESFQKRYVKPGDCVNCPYYQFKHITDIRKDDLLYRKSRMLGLIEDE